MECPKCKGFMMLERFSDFFLIFYAWKCINCGALIDRTISNNRRKSLPAKTVETNKVVGNPVKESPRHAPGKFLTPFHSSRPSVYWSES